MDEIKCLFHCVPTYLWNTSCLLLPWQDNISAIDSYLSYLRMFAIQGLLLSVVILLS